MKGLARLTLLCSGLTLHAAAAADDRAFGPFGTAPDTPGHGMGFLTMLGVLLLAAAGAFVLLRGRTLPLANRAPRRLVIDETKSLGSRQYLVVASYEGRKLLLGVCPGRIDLLTPLDAPKAP